MRLRFERQLRVLNTIAPFRSRRYKA